MRPQDESKKLAIKEKAIQMIVKEGFDGLSMQKLAKAAGVSPATIYIYFKDRDNLIIQISAEEGKKMVDAMLKDFDPEVSFAEGLRVQWKNRAVYCINNPLKMNFLEQIRYSPFCDKLFKIDNSFIYAMKTFVNNAIERNELRKLPIEVFWSVAYAPLYQLVKFHLAPFSMPGSEKFVLDDATMDAALEIVVKALKP